MQDIDTLTISIHCTTSETYAALTSLKARVNEVDSLLDTWLDEYRREHTIPDGLELYELYWTSTALPRSTNTALSRPIDFATVAVASMMMTYWTYKLELAMLQEEIYALTAVSKVANTEHSASTLATSSQRLASLICRSTTYWLEKEHVSTHVYMYMLIFPYRVAWAWFARQPQLYVNEISACRTVRERLLTGVSKTRVAEFVIDQLYKGPPGEA